MAHNKLNGAGTLWEKEGVVIKVLKQGNLSRINQNSF